MPVHRLLHGRAPVARVGDGKNDTCPWEWWELAALEGRGEMRQKKGVTGAQCG